MARRDFIPDIPITKQMIREVPCGKCGAKAGEKCKRPGGPRGKLVASERNHYERMQHAQRVGGSSLLLKMQEAGRRQAARRSEVQA